VQKPTVAIMHYSCPPVIGGVEFILEAHARAFKKAGFDTRVIVGKGGAFEEGVPVVTIPELSSKGGPVARVVAALTRGEVPASFENVVKRVEKKLAAALRGVDVCMVHNVLTMHFNMVFTTALCNVIRRRRATRFIGWTHDLTFRDPIYESHQHRRFPWSLLLQPAPECDYVAISVQRQRDLRRLFRIPASRLPVIPDGLDVPAQLGLTEPVAQLFHEERLGQIDIVAITPCRILRRKNLGVGLEIISALKKQGKSVRWMITGAPDVHNPETVKYFRLLHTLRRRLKLQKEVVFLCDRFAKPVTNDDLRALYRTSDMLLFPSEREGFGLPVLEAGLAGLLVVINDIPVLRELAGRNAVYIHLGDSADIVARNVIQSFKKNPQYQYRKKVLSTYSWDAVFEDWILPAILKPSRVWT
jgi:glycosyltransferase involved in cell wall biosynthesis